MKHQHFTHALFRREPHAGEHGDCRTGPHGFERHLGGPRHRRGFDFGPGWGPRARRGDVKYLILEALADGPRHGYDIMSVIEERRGFRPSPGSVYPTVQMLEDGGFVTGTEVEGKRVYTVTDAGRELLAKRGLEANEDDDQSGRHGLKAAVLKLMPAIVALRDCDETTLERARAILDRARKEVYALLADAEN